ncbi:MAG: L-threonylcarbamoyladenylate synthase, partial [Planctomycetota bacterium]|nr:L-threonylcarbamoyladenylate synthase [Planctomycetota bacterium]
MRTTQRITIEQIQTAADLLIDGKLVAFPTETVYGLGADALNPAAVKRIFEAKGRPSDNPLIAHIASLEQLTQLVRAVSPLAKLLMERFWPGPLTLVMDKDRDLPDDLTAGLDTVAVRMPEDPIALDLIRRVGRPIVAPSANRSGRPSATTWESVLIDLDGRIDGVL